MTSFKTTIRMYSLALLGLTAAAIPCATVMAQQAPNAPSTQAAVSKFVSNPDFCNYYLGMQRGEDLSKAYGEAFASAIADTNIAVGTHIEALKKACIEKAQKATTASR
jgi:hypothetical protein